MNTTQGYRDGITFSPDFDYDRLNDQAKRVFDVMKDGEWKTLHVIGCFAKAPEASVSARLRDLRKERFGSLNIERRYVQNGLWEYRLLPQGVLF